MAASVSSFSCCTFLWPFFKSRSSWRLICFSLAVEETERREVFEECCIVLLGEVGERDDDGGLGSGVWGFIGTGGRWLVGCHRGVWGLGFGVWGLGFGRSEERRVGK